MVTPPGGTVFDPFGIPDVAEAAQVEGFLVLRGGSELTVMENNP